MLIVEYLVFIDNESIKCTDTRTFNHLLQSDPNISVANNILKFQKLEVDYHVKSGKVKNTEKHYFHLILECKSISKIDDFTQLLRSVKSVLHITNKTPQTLYDGISLHYSQEAYPLIFEVENLMRKLITKFMLTNVGVDWIKERVPDDVKNSINLENRDMTYLHNVDFIQLKNFLFSENYPLHKETLINKLKTAKNIAEFNLEDLKTLIPNSNWEKYFSSEVDITKEKLSQQWDELYSLRCKIAHNRAFAKSDYQKVEKLHTELKVILKKAISNLDNIVISIQEQEQLTENIAINFSHAAGEFISGWLYLTKNIYQLVEDKIRNNNPELIDDSHFRDMQTDLKLLHSQELIDKHMLNDIKLLTNIRNRIIHHGDKLSADQMEYAVNKVQKVGKTLNGYL